MPLRAALPVIGLVAAMLVLWQVVPWTALFHWAVTAQREFQDAMARALRAVQAGEPAAVWTLCGATALYGFVHAMGPGHGKVLLGGAALASGATLRRMTVLTLAASLAQAGAAILLVGGLATLLGLGARQMGDLADTWLAPASYAAIAAIGGYLIIRGLRLFRPQPAQTCGCGHAHGPSVQETASLTGWRDAALLVGSIALRPCTGALFVLAIALRFDMFWTGALAVVAMGLGTAAFNLAVAWSGVVARRATILSASGSGELRLVSAGVHVAGGALIAVISLGWLMRFFG